MKDKDKEQQQQQQQHQVRQYLRSNFLAFNFKATSKITLNIFWDSLNGIYSRIITGHEIYLK